MVSICLSGVVRDLCKFSLSELITLKGNSHTPLIAWDEPEEAEATSAIGLWALEAAQEVEQHNDGFCRSPSG